MKETFSNFGLTVEQTEVLFSLQRMLIVADLRNERKKKPILGDNKAETKQRWLNKWDTSIITFLAKLGGSFKISDCEYSSIRNKVSEIDKNAQNTVWKYMIFLECVLYTAYYPLDTDKEAYKQFKGLKMDKAAKKEELSIIAAMLNIDYKYIKIFEDAYSSAIKKLSGYWTKVAMGAGIGIIVILIAIVTFQYEIIAFFAAEGLSGAAAISAGLAALGGGAVAAGGFGMAGGIAVLIGGGTLLGASAGTAAGFSIASLGANAVLSEAAKLQVVLKEIVLAIQKDTKYFQELLIKIEQQIHNLRQENIKLNRDVENNKKKIKNLEESIKILEKLVKINC